MVLNYSQKTPELFFNLLSTDQMWRECGNTINWKATSLIRFKDDKFNKILDFSSLTCTSNLKKIEIEKEFFTMVFTHREDQDEILPDPTEKTSKLRSRLVTINR